MPSPTAITKSPHFYPFQSTMGSRNFTTDHPAKALCGDVHSDDVPMPMAVTPCRQ